jgi:nitroreductase
VFTEAEHAAQNLCLQAVALELGSVVIGAFSDRKVGSTQQLVYERVPLYTIPVGKERQSYPH